MISVLAESDVLKLLVRKMVGRRDGVLHLRPVHDGARPPESRHVVRILEHDLLDLVDEPLALGRVEGSRVPCEEIVARGVALEEQVGIVHVVEGFADDRLEVPRVGSIREPRPRRAPRSRLRRPKSSAAGRASPGSDAALLRQPGSLGGTPNAASARTPAGHRRGRTPGPREGRRRGRSGYCDARGGDRDGSAAEEALTPGVHPHEPPPAAAARALKDVQGENPAPQTGSKRGWCRSLADPGGGESPGRHRSSYIRVRGTTVRGTGADGSELFEAEVRRCAESGSLSCSRPLP